MSVYARRPFPAVRRRPEGADRFRHVVQGRWYDTATIELDHAEDAVSQIAELAGKLRFVGLPKTLIRKVAIASRADVPQQVVAQRIRTELCGQRNGVNGIAGRLADLAAVHRHIAVDKDP